MTRWVVTRWSRPATLALVALALAAVLFLFVFPTRSYIAQRGDIGAARRDVAVLREQNEKLAREAQRLQSEEEIERLARNQFHMVFPGEDAYMVIPAPEPATTTTTTAPAVP
jgi:cell division protein FtsB